MTRTERHTWGDDNVDYITLGRCMVWGTNTYRALARNIHGFKATLPLGIPILLLYIGNLKIDLLRCQQLLHLLTALVKTLLLDIRLEL
jgi:hypothetical protein